MSTIKSWEGAVEWLREQKSQRALVEWCYYDDPLIQAAERYRGSEEWLEIKRLFASTWPRTVLEIGAGRGIVSCAFAHEGSLVTALEPDSSKLVGAGAIRQLCDESGARVAICQTCGESLPFEAASFDLVVCRCVLHHASNLTEMCREIGRVLRPGGRLLAIKEHVVDGPESLSEFLKNHPLHHLYGGENAFRIEEYKEAIQAAGMSISELYGFYESPLCYSPMMTSADIQGKLEEGLRRRVGGRLARLLVSAEWIRRAGFKLLSRRDRSPGRLVSLVARKGL